jgi:hypothetical protein
MVTGRREDCFFSGGVLGQAVVVAAVEIANAGQYAEPVGHLPHISQIGNPGVGIP